MEVSFKNQSVEYHRYCLSKILILSKAVVIISKSCLIEYFLELGTVAPQYQSHLSWIFKGTLLGCISGIFRWLNQEAKGASSMIQFLKNLNDRIIDSIFNAAIARTGPGRSQEPGPSFRSPMCIEESQVLESHLPLLSQTEQ